MTDLDAMAWQLFNGNHSKPAILAMLQAIIDDARAGMVPFNEGWGEPKDTSACSRCAGADPHCYICGCRLTIDLLKAELAKAWEAGRDAAWRAMATCNDKTHAEELRAISKLQPPGGKAK